MAHFFPFLILVIFVVAKLIAASQRNSDGGGTGPVRRNFPPQNESEEERIRRFMKAVGRPTGTNPPPVVRPRPLASAKPLLPVNPPSEALVVPPGRLKRVRTPEPARPQMAPPMTMASKPEPIIQQARPASAPAAAQQTTYTRPLASTPPQQQSAPPVSTWAGTPAASLLTKLRDPVSIRQAIILREVLGPPKAFQGNYGGWNMADGAAGRTTTREPARATGP